jgi:hypothetical protein
LFGDAALKLKNGRLALGFNGKGVTLIDIAAKTPEKQAAE